MMITTPPSLSLYIYMTTSAFQPHAANINFVSFALLCTHKITNVLDGSILCDCTKSYNIFPVHRCWHHVQFSRRIYRAQKFLIQFVRSHQSKTYQSKLYGEKEWKFINNFNQFMYVAGITLTSLQITNRLSFMTNASKRLANSMWWRI